MKRTQIYFPKTQLDALRQLASERRETVSETIRTLLKPQLEKRPSLGEAKKHPTLFDVLNEVKKMNQSGPKDLAKNLDKYLYGNR